MLDYAVLLAMVFYALACPWTKVEESFNTQAVHDCLYERANLSNYDHYEFAGVVPRTFAAPLLLCAVCAPAAYILHTLLHVPLAHKHIMLAVVRCTLSLCTWLVWRRYSQSVRRVFGSGTGHWLALITCSQFHYVYYASRPLPNTFANLLVLPVLSLWLRERYASAVFVATVSAAAIRSELVLLYAPIFAPALLTGRCRLRDAAKCGFAGLAAVLVLTVPLDSLMWRRIVWPEAYVWYYNVLMNRSADWGVSPPLWYVYSALPRSLVATLPLCALGALAEPRCRRLALPPAAFLCAYSLLPHKELRFIIYTLPVFNTCAARFCHRVWTAHRRKGPSVIRSLLLAACALHLFANGAASALFYTAARHNYPSGDALLHLHRLDIVRSAPRPPSVHIDVFCAQNGISRFLHLNQSWTYSKTEGQSAIGKRLSGHSLLCVGSPHGLTHVIGEHTAAGYSTMFTVAAFDRLHVQTIDTFPYYWPVLRYVDKVAIMRLK